MPSYTQSILSPDALYLQPKSYDARSDRKWFSDILTKGVVGQGDFLVTWTSGLNISIAGGVAYILGANIADQGMYRQYVASATPISVPVNTNANPRVDQVILRILDAAADANAGNLYESRIEVVPGTPTAAATLANRSGVADLTTLLEASKSVILLADLLVPGSSGNLSAGAIGDRRLFASVKGAGQYITVAEFAQIIAPTDGQEVYIIVDATNGVIWHFRYNAGSGSSFKWEFLGGPALMAVIEQAEGTYETTTSGTYVDLTTVGPSVTVPRAGDYFIHFGAQASLPATSGQGANMSIKLGASAIANAERVLGQSVAGVAQPFSLARTMKRTLAINDVLKAMYRADAGSAAGFNDRFVSAIPIRVS